MKYIATLNMPPYLEQFVRAKSGWVDSDRTIINIAPFTSASLMLKRNLVPFVSEEAARSRWPQQFRGVKVGLPELHTKHLKNENEFTFYCLGPEGSNEVMMMIKAFFDLQLMQDWTTTLAEYTKLMMIPEKKAFFLSFMERNGIDYSDTNFSALEKRMLRIINMVETKPIVINEE